MEPISAGQTVYVLFGKQVVSCQVAFSFPPVYGVVNTGEPPFLPGAPEAITLYGEWDLGQWLFTDQRRALDALHGL